MALTKVSSSLVSDNAITTGKLVDGGVHSADIATNAITSTKIAQNSILTKHIDDGQVTTAQLGADAVTAAKIADDAISEEHLDVTVITGLTEVTAATGDLLMVADISDSNNLKKIPVSSILAGTHTGAVNTSGNVTLGSSTAGALEVGSANSFQIQKSGVNAFINQSDSGPIIIRMGSGFTERARMDTNGNITVKGAHRDMLTLTRQSSNGDSGIQFANTSGNLTTIVAATLGDFTIDTAGDIILDADGDNIFYKAGGSSFYSISNVSGTTYLGVEQADKDLIIRGNNSDGGGVFTALTLDMSEGGNAIFNENITAGQNIVATDATSVIQTPRVSIEADGTIDWGASRNYGTLTWDTNKAIVRSQSGSTLELWTNESTTAVAFDTSGNATFSGTISSGAITSSSSIRANDWYRGASNTNTLFSNTSQGTIIQTPSNTNNAAGTFFIRDNLANVHFSLNTNTNASSFHGGTISSGAITSSGVVSAEDDIYLTDAGTIRGKLLLNASDRDNVELRAESLGSTMKFFTVGTQALLLDASQNATFAGGITAGPTGVSTQDHRVPTGTGYITYSPANQTADVLNIRRYGTVQQKFDQYGVTFPSSNVGIGFTNPSNKLSVNGVITSGNFAAASISGSIGDANTAEVGPGYINLARDDTADAAQIRFGKNGAVHSYLETRTNGLGFITDVGNFAFEGGNVGIGTAAPQQKLDALGTIRSTHNIVSNTVYKAFSIGSNRTINDYGGLNKDYWAIQLATPGSSTDGQSSGHAYGALKFSGVSGSDTTLDDVLVLNYNGNVGINCINPEEKLVVDGGVKIANSNKRLYFGTEGSTSHRALEGSVDGNVIQVGEGYTNVLLGSASAKVGIRQTSPDAMLHIDGATSSIAAVILEGNTNGDVISLQMKAKANNGTLSYHGLTASPGADQDDNTISLGNGGGNGVVVDHQNVATARYIKAFGGGTYAYDVGGSYLGANGADFGTHAIFRTPSVSSPSSGAASTQFLTVYSSGHWGEYPVCRFRLYTTYFSGGYREYLFRQVAGTSYLTEVQNNGTSSSWGASPGSITKGSTTSTGATHSGQTVYRTALTFTSTGAYLRNYVVTEIMFGANRYYSSANTQAQIDALSNLGGKYHFKTISLAEGRGYFAS